MLALTGPSGSGRSTLVALAGLLRPPAADQVFHGSEDAGSASPAWMASQRQALRFVFQRPYLLRSLRVAENTAASVLARVEPAEFADCAAALPGAERPGQTLTGGTVQPPATLRGAGAGPDRHDAPAARR